MIMDHLGIVPPIAPKIEVDRSDPDRITGLDDVAHGEPVLLRVPVERGRDPRTVETERLQGDLDFTLRALVKTAPFRGGQTITPPLPDRKHGLDVVLELTLEANDLHADSDGRLFLLT